VATRAVFPRDHGDHEGCGPLGYSDELGRRVRAGGWSEQAASTWAKALTAVDGGRFDEAAELADFFADEARIINGLLDGLVAQLREFLTDRGVDEVELGTVDERVRALLAMPDGTPLEEGRQFARFLRDVRTFIVACGKEDPERCRDLGTRFKESWRQVHDRRVDHVCGLINEILQRFGEEAVGEFHRLAMEPLFAGRYARFDIQSYDWPKALDMLMYLTFEAMRAHLTGPDRSGTMEVIEEEDRWLVRFDPCGTGGRTLRSDEVEGTGPRTGHPYNWPVLQEEHDFAWNTKGVCAYCAHCCVVMEQLPIDKFGYPLRVVEPPTWPNDASQPCTWIMYKDATAVPERYYERVGRTKPTDLGKPPGAAA
jgi:hypothetical protein